MKHCIIVGNWKSNKLAHEVPAWVDGIAQHLSPHIASQALPTIVVCAPFTVLSTLQKTIADKAIPVSLGAQNVSAYGSGAYTGEVYADQVKEFAQYVLIGHTERRKYFGEKTEDLAEKVTQAKKAGLTVLYCVGGADVPVPAGVDIVCYEPEWAIGTGKTETPENANLVAKSIQEKTGISQVLYGGSVKPDNVGAFLSQEHLAGVLPGAASLDPATFFPLIEAGMKVG